MSFTNTYQFDKCMHSNNFISYLSHTHTHNRFTALWKLSGTTRVSRYQKKHSPTTLIVVIDHPYLLSPLKLIYCGKTWTF